MNYLNETINSLNQKLANGEVSTQRLAGKTIANIKETDKRVNAFITVDEGAKTSENLDFANKLTGVPVTVKDNIVTDGLKTIAASHILDNFIPVYDATIVSKLRKAGATVVGKTNLDEFAMGSSNKNSYFDAVHSPWNLDKVPGGSSGGSAAAVASDEIMIALGSDTGGSIHQPTVFNGIFSIKPAYGRVPRWDLVAFASSLDQIGVLTRRVQDTAEVSNVISGADEHDSTVSEKIVPDFTKTLGQDVKGLRIAVPREYVSDVADEGVHKAIQEQIDFLKENGAIINEVSFPHTRYVVSTYYIIASSEANLDLQGYDGTHYGYCARDAKNLLDIYVKSHSEGFGNEVKRRIMLGSFALPTGSYDEFFRQASKVRTLICRDFGKTSEDDDVIVGPTTTEPAFEIGSEVKNPTKMYNNDVLTISVDVSDVPAASVPAGLINGMPVGLQIIAKRLDEKSVLRIADFIERNSKSYEKKPARLED